MRVNLEGGQEPGTGDERVRPDREHAMHAVKQAPLRSENGLRLPPWRYSESAAMSCRSRR